MARTPYDQRLIHELDRNWNGSAPRRTLGYNQLHQSGVDHSQVLYTDPRYQNAQQLNSLNVYGTHGYHPPEAPPQPQASHPDASQYHQLPQGGIDTRYSHQSRGDAYPQMQPQPSPYEAPSNPYPEGQFAPQHTNWEQAQSPQQLGYSDVYQHHQRPQRGTNPNYGQPSMGEVHDYLQQHPPNIHEMAPRYTDSNQYSEQRRGPYGLHTPSWDNIQPPQQARSPMEGVASGSGHQLDAPSDISCYNVPIHIKGYNFGLRRNLTFRDAPIAALDNQQRNAPGIHLTHPQHPEFEIYIPPDVINITRGSYTHATDITNRLNKYVNNSVNPDLLSKLLYDTRNGNKRNTIGSIEGNKWKIRIVSPQPQEHSG
jgi:hypothetical protein